MVYCDILVPDEHTELIKGDDRPWIRNVRKTIENVPFLLHGAISVNLLQISSAQYVFIEF